VVQGIYDPKSRGQGGRDPRMVDISVKGSMLRGFVDGGSDDCHITQAAANKLDMELRPRTRYIERYGGVTATSHDCDIWINNKKINLTVAPALPGGVDILLDARTAMILAGAKERRRAMALVAQRSGTMDGESPLEGGPDMELDEIRGVMRLGHTLSSLIRLVLTKLNSKESWSRSLGM
jgi:hypothetical protein